MIVKQLNFQDCVDYHIFMLDLGRKKREKRETLIDWTCDSKRLEKRVLEYEWE